MAKVTGPLLSNTASGSIGPRLTYSNKETGQQVRFQRAQKDVLSSKRIIQRSKYSLAVSAWNALEQSTKDLFNLLAVDERLSGYNLFIKLHIGGEIIDSDSSVYGYRNYGIMIYGKI